MSKQLFQFQISKINEEESLLTIRNVSEKIPEGIFLFIASNEYTFSICAENTLHIPFKNITLSRNDFAQTIPNSEIKTIKRALKEFHSYSYRKFSKIVPKKKSLQDYLKERNVTEDELLELFESGVVQKAVKHIDLQNLLEYFDMEEETETISETYSKIFLRN